MILLKATITSKQSWNFCSEINSSVFLTEKNMLFIQFGLSLMHTSNMLYVNNQVWVAVLILIYKQEACTESFKTSDITVISVGIYCSMYFLLSCTEMLVIIHVLLYLFSVIFLVFSLLKNEIFNFDYKKKTCSVVQNSSMENV